MKKVVSLSIILFGMALGSQAQSIYAPVGGRVVAMGDAAVTLGGFWSGFQNTAGITNTDQIEIGTNYENRFGLAGFNFMSAGVTSPLPFGHLFAGVFRFGDELYNEHKVSIGYASKIGIIKLGGRVNYLQYQILDFGTRATYSIDFGGIAEISPSLIIGAQALNITQSNLEKEQEQLIPTLLKIGASYRPKTYFMLNVEIEKDIQQAAILKIGAEYNFLEKFYLRTGINGGAHQTFYGLGFKYLHFHWDYAMSNHPELGFSHSLSMHYKLRKK